jgi:hypothetical protein
MLAIGVGTVFSVILDHSKWKFYHTISNYVTLLSIEINYE